MWARLYLWASTCHETHIVTDRVVWVHHCRDEHCTHSSHWQLWCRVGYMPYQWRAMSQWSDKQQVQDRCPRFPLDTNKDPCCCTQPTTITLSPAEAAIIYFHNSATLPPPPTTIKISCKEQIKINFDIALRHTAVTKSVVPTEYRRFRLDRNRPLR